MCDDHGDDCDGKYDEGQIIIRMQQQGDYDDNADKRIEWIVNKIMKIKIEIHRQRQKYKCTSALISSSNDTNSQIKQ